MLLKIEEASTVIDFTLTAQQRDLQLTSRKFAKEVLNEAKAAELLATPEERFRATRPTYEAMVAAGYLRKCIPAPAGGDNAGLIDMAILAEEFYSVNPSVTLTMLGTVLGLLPVLLGGTPDQCKRLLGPFLKTSGAPLAGFCSSEPGGSANAASPPPGEGVRTMARREGDNWVIDGRKKWVSSATGWNREGANVLCVVCRTDPAALPDAAMSIIAVEGPVTGLVFERAIDTIGHRAHLVPQFGFQNVATPTAICSGRRVRGSR
jgi:butyryl-CoA dehydrogenase